MLCPRIVAQSRAIGLQKANVAVKAAKQGLSVHPFRSRDGMHCIRDGAHSAQADVHILFHRELPVCACIFPAHLKVALHCVISFSLVAQALKDSVREKHIFQVFRSLDCFELLDPPLHRVFHAVAHNFFLGQGIIKAEPPSIGTRLLR